MFKILLAVIIVTTTILFFDLEIARSQVSSEAMDQSEIVLEKATINNDILLYISENKFIIENIDHGIRREIVSIPVIDFILSPTNLQFIFVTTYQQVGVGEISFSDEGLIVTTKLLQDSKNHPIVNRSWNNGFFRVIWAKDGSRFAYLATNSKYYSYNLSGDELALPDSMTQFFGWSIDNHWIAYCEADQSFWVKGQNENPFLVYQQATCQSDILITSPVLWSPTENIIAYTYNFFYEFMSDGPPNPGQTGIFDVQTKKVLSQNTGAPGSWSPDGEMINLVQIISIGATGHYFANLVVVEKNNKPLIQIENVDITRGLFSRGYSWGWYGKDYLFGNIHISDDKNQIEEFPWEVIQASEQGNSILAYQINGPNLSNVYCVQREMGGIEPLSFVDSSRLSGVAMPGLWGAISPDGNWVAISILTDTGSIRRLGRCDGTKEIDLVPYDNYLFSPNSRWLAGEGDLDQDGVQVWLYNLNDATNYPMPINIDQNDGYAYYAWLKFPTPITGNGTSVTKTDETPSIHPPSPEILETQPANTSSTSEEDLGNLKKLYQLNFISIFTALIIYFCVNLIFLVYIFPNYSKRLYLRTSKITCKFWLAWIFVALLSSFISYWASQLISGYGNLLVFINKVISWSIAILLNSFGQSWLWKRSKDYSRKWLFISILSVFAGLLITVVLGSSIKIGNLLNSAGLVGGVAAWSLISFGEFGMIMLQRPRISSTINTIIAFIVGRLVGVLAGISFSFIVGDYIIFGNWSFNFYWPVVLFVSEFATLSILFWGNHNYVVPNYLSWGLISIFGFTFGAELNKYSLARISEFFSFHISNLGFIILFLGLAQSFIIRKYIPLKSWITLAFILIILENAVYNFFGLNSSAYWVIAVWVITWIAQGILINRHINKRWWVWAILNIIILIVGIILESMISESGLEKKLNTRFDDVLVKEIMDRFSIYIPYYLNFIVTGFYLFYGNIQDLSFSKKVRGNI